MKNKEIYFDNNATTLIDPELSVKLSNVISEYYGNPSSPHIRGDLAKGIVSRARLSVAESIGCKEEEVIFASGGTEANALALKNNPEIGDLAICSAAEHSSVLSCCMEKIRINKEGFLDLNHLEDIFIRLRAWKGRKIFASMLVNNETGVFADPNQEAYNLCQKYNIGYHIDAVQAYGKLGSSIDISKLKCDTLSVSPHKAHGLAGTGILYVRTGYKISPGFCGGSQERGYRPGTENLLGIYSAGFIAGKVIKETTDMSGFIEKIENKLSDISEINGAKKFRINNTTNLYFPTIPDSEMLIENLSNRGVFVSGKSACQSGFVAPSSVLLAMFGSSSERLNRSIRISLSKLTTEEEVNIGIDIIREEVEKISVLKG